jgi:hypothetical protein
MNPQMRMLILLAVFWAAGSLLLAAESPSTPKPAAADKPAAVDKPAVAEKPATDKAGAAEKPVAEEKKAAAEESKTDTAQGKGSIAEQAEAALKAAAEADPGGAPSETPKTEATEAKDDTQAAPTASAGKGRSPQRFVPTEQVRADFDVSFPIDI